MSTLQRYRPPSRAPYQPGSVPAGIAQVARSLVESVAGLTVAERRFLHDLARTEGRYAWVALERLVGLAKRSENPVHREALAEHLRAASLDREVAIDVVAAADAVVESQGPLNVAVRAYERRPALATKAAAESAIVLDQARLRQLLDALEAAPVTAI